MAIWMYWSAIHGGILYTLSMQSAMEWDSPIEQADDNGQYWAYQQELEYQRYLEEQGGEKNDSYNCRT
jgi:hypothetical protein